MMIFIQFFRALIFVISISSISTVIASKSDQALSLYQEALSILSNYPQFTHNYTLNSENKIVINVPIDIDLDYQKELYEIESLELSTDKREAKRLLEESSALGDINATFLLAEMNLYGNYSYPKNGSLALQYYHRVIELSENATAYFNLGVIYSTGLFGQVEVNQAKANLYYTFAFEQGDLRAAMVLGYRYAYGISVPADLSTSLFYYQYVADKMKEEYDKGPIGGPSLDSYSIRISDFQGGIYGKGVGDTPSSLLRKASRFDEFLNSNSLNNDGTLFDELYYKVAKYYEGSYMKKRDFNNAFKFANLAMEHGIQQLSSLTEMDRKYVAGCIYILSRMYLRGEGVTQDFTQALVHLKKSTDIFPLAPCYNDMGLIYEYGPEAIRDRKKAITMYERASNMSLKTGTYNYGRLIMADNPEKGVSLIKKASNLLELSAMYAATEFYYLEEGPSRREKILKNLKYYVEQFDPYLTSLEWAFFELVSGRDDNALIGYAMAAEQGFETAQATVGYILYHLPTILDPDPPVIPKARKDMAITYLTRSSIQFNTDSTVMLGDIYFADKDYEKAAVAYSTSSSRGSSQGNFNLGWLHEEGYGVEKDFHLAKRHYDLALLSHPKAYLPVQIALLRLKFKSFVNKLTGGKINSIDGKEKNHRSWSDWKALYHKIRGTNDQNFGNNEAQNEHQLSGDLDGSELGSEDFIMIGLMFVPFGLIFLFHFLQQLQIRRRRANNEEEAAPRFEFNVRVIAI